MGNVTSYAASGYNTIVSAVVDIEALRLDQPLDHARADEVYRGNIGRLIKRGIYTPPAHAFPGAGYIPTDDTPPAEAWERMKVLWEGWGEV